jgi:hypothetical protein
VGWIEGVVTLIKGSAWPIVVLVSVLVLKRQLGQLIGRVTHFSGPAGVSADFGQQAEAANELAEAITPEPANDLPPLAEKSEVNVRFHSNHLPTLVELRTAAQLHPIGAVVQAWAVVEGTAHQAFPSTQHPFSTRRIVDLISSQIEADLGSLAARLGRLRNDVVHGTAMPTTDEALDYVNAAWRLASAIDASRRKRDGDD